MNNRCRRALVSAFLSALSGVLPAASLPAFLVSASSCQLEQLFADEVAHGVARLTVLNSAMLLDVANRDAACGFASPAALASVQVQGEVGALGQAVWRVDDCVIALDPKQDPGVDCHNVETTVGGTVRVSGTRTVRGRVTGDAANPVVPESADAVTLALAADVEDLEVVRSDSDQRAVYHRGRFDLTASAPLAVSAALGVCAVPTRNVTLTTVALQGAALTVHDGARAFEVPVPQASLSAQIGAFGDRENDVEGRVTVWEQEVAVAAGTAFDERYDAEHFVASYSCDEALQQPLSHECPSVQDRLADGAARLTIQLVGSLASAVSDDTACGFGSAAVRAAAEVEGEVGRAGGRVTSRIDGCVLDFGAGAVVDESCDGGVTRAVGRARVSGTMVVEGRLTGNALEPVIPGARDAVTLTLRLELEDLSVQGANPERLTVEQGTVTAVVRPRMAVDEGTGACSIATPIAAFDDVTWQAGARARLDASGSTFALRLEGSTLRAVNGPRDGEENHLSGTITLGDDVFEVPVSGPPALDPAFDRGAFLASFACTPNLRLASSDEDCSMRQVIGDGVARLLIQTVGTLASAINSDDDCGFANTMDVLKNPSEVVGDAGEMGHLRWDIDGCQVGRSTPSTFATDCTGNVTHWSGTASLSASRVVRGRREDIEVFLLGRVADSVAPLDPMSVDLWLDDVALSSFSTWTEPADGSAPLGVLTLHQGTLSATVQPMTGYSDEQERYTVPTPVARLSDVRLQGARATLLAQGITFEVDIGDAALQATNGALAGRENDLAGTVVVDGETITVGGALNPAYDPAALAATWACNVAPEVGACAQTPPSLWGLWALGGLAAAALRRRRPRLARP